MQILALIQEYCREYHGMTMTISERQTAISDNRRPHSSQGMHTLADLISQARHAYSSSMSCLVITVLQPPDPAHDHHGVYQRLRMFLQVLGKLHGLVDILHFTEKARLVPGEEERSSAIGSEYWGTPVRVTLLPLDLAPRRPWQTPLALTHLRWRGAFRPFLGAAPVLALRAAVSAWQEQNRQGLIFAHRLPAMTALARAGINNTPVFFDLDDVEHLVRRRAATIPAGRIASFRARLEIPALATEERRALNRASATFICSEHDLGRLHRDGFDTRRVVVAPNAVAIPNSQHPLSAQMTALFLGNYGHAPNAEAAELLIARIWPIVRARIGDAKLIIAGANPDRIPSFHERPEGVEFPGFVDDLPKLYARTRIVCCPLRNGGGTRLKLIEAAGFGRPIVASSIACEGLAFHDGRDAMIRDPEGAFAEACIQLLTDDAVALKQSDAAYRLAKALYTLPRIQSQIAMAMAQAMKPSGPPMLRPGLPTSRELAYDESRR
jgi:glycosyltransferase involved in cell wall biosynthesis